MRKPIGKKLRFEVFKRDGFVCAYCGATPPQVVLQVDHIQPVKDGGTNDIDNLVTSCQPCNIGKGARSLESIPQSLSDKAALISEKEDQLKEYQEIIKSQRDRINDEAFQVSDILSDNGLWNQDFLTVKRFIEKLGVYEVIDAAEIAIAKFPRTKARSFRYFCGICLNRIRGE